MTSSQEENVLLNLVYNERWDDAIAKAKTEEVREELRRKGRRGGLPLHRVCQYDAPLELVEAMVGEYPEAVRVTDDYKSLPLHYACQCGYDISPRVVRLLLDAYPEGAKKATTEYGHLPLHYAASRKDPSEVLEMLIDAHPEGVTTRNKVGCLPLHHLARKASPDEKEDVEKVELLFRPLLDNEEACLVPDRVHRETALDIGAKLNVLSLHTCVQIPRCPAGVIMKVAGFLPGQLSERDDNGNLPLHVAAANPNLNGTKVDSEDFIGKLVNLYPEAAAASDGNGRSPLSLTIESGKRWHEGVEAIVDAAERVATIDDEHIVLVRDEATNLYPFMLAASTGDDPCITTVYSLLRRCPELKRYALD